MRYAIDGWSEAADWTDEHRQMAATATELGLPNPEPHWVVVLVLTEDVDGIPTAVDLIRQAGVTNCPPTRERSHEDG